MRRWIPWAIITLLCCAGCAPVPRIPAPVEPGTSQVVTVSPIPVVPPETWSATPARPPGGDVFSAPQAVAAEWMRQWCGFDWREPMNANLDRAARFETEPAARADRKRGDNAASYDRARAQQVTSTCDQVSAAPNPEAPQAADTAYFLVSARRTNSAAGVPFETETVRSMRRVTRQPDGHWLVGDQVEAG